MGAPFAQISVFAVEALWLGLEKVLIFFRV